MLFLYFSTRAFLSKTMFSPSHLPLCSTLVVYVIQTAKGEKKKKGLVQFLTRKEAKNEKVELTTKILWCSHLAILQLSTYLLFVSQIIQNDSVLLFPSILSPIPQTGEVN